MAVLKGKKFELPGVYSISAPEPWERQLAEDVDLYLVSPDDEGSGVFLGLWPVDWHNVDVKTQLLEATAVFMKRIVEGGDDAFRDATSLTTQGDDLEMCRTLVDLENDRVWIVQLVFIPHKSALCLLHWNGPRTGLDQIILILDTFQVLAPSN